MWEVEQLRRMNPRASNGTWPRCSWTHPAKTGLRAERIFGKAALSFAFSNFKSAGVQPESKLSVFTVNRRPPGGALSLLAMGVRTCEHLDVK
jgi:hypothetical protein